MKHCNPDCELGNRLGELGFACQSAVPRCGQDRNNNGYSLFIYVRKSLYQNKGEATVLEEAFRRSADHFTADRSRHP